MVSVAIICQDEEEVLPLTLECLVPIVDILTDVVIVDGGSRDGTIDVVYDFYDKLPEKVFVRKFDNFSAQKNFALDHCGGTWVLGLDADMVFNSLAFKNLMLAHAFDGWPIWDWALFFARGDLRHYCTASTSSMPTTRLWKNLGLRYEREVHEYLVFPGETGWDSIHSRGRIRNTDACAILETHMLKSDEAMRNRVRRYAKWADKSESLAGIGLGAQEKFTEAIIANRWDGVKEIPQSILDGIPPKVFEYTLARRQHDPK